MEWQKNSFHTKSYDFLRNLQCFLHQLISTDEKDEDELQRTSQNGQHEVRHVISVCVCKKYLYGWHIFTYSNFLILDRRTGYKSCLMNSIQSIYM